MDASSEQGIALRSKRREAEGAMYQRLGTRWGTGRGEGPEEVSSACQDLGARRAPPDARPGQRRLQLHQLDRPRDLALDLSVEIAEYHSYEESLKTVRCFADVLVHLPGAAVGRASIHCHQEMHSEQWKQHQHCSYGFPKLARFVGVRTQLRHEDSDDVAEEDKVGKEAEKSRGQSYPIVSSHVVHPARMSHSQGSERCTYGDEDGRTSPSDDVED